MGTKLVRLNLTEGLHRRIKTLAAWHDSKIEDYITEVLEKHVPKTITLSEEAPTKEKQPKSVN